MTAPLILTAGAPSPDAPQFHRPLVREPLALTNGVPVVFTVAIAGANLGRLRWLSTAAATISYAFLRPAPFQDTAYGADNPANSTVLAATEDSADLTFVGEALLRITLTPGASGTLTFLDFMALRP
jgi:hypothetical protein